MRQRDIKHLDLNLLRVLHVLLEERNVSRAAERLFLSQSATSHALARLRQHFNDPLLTRTARGMRPTSLAEAMAPTLTRVLSDVAGLAGDAPFAPESAEGLVRITALATGTITLAPRLVRALGAQAPMLNVEIQQWHEGTLDEIEAGRIEFGIGTRPQCEREGLAMQRLFADRFACVMRKDHPAARKPLTKEVYETWPHVVVDAAIPMPGSLLDVLDAHDLNRSSTLTTQHLLTAHLIAEQTDMILTATRTVAGLFARNADMAIVDPPFDLGELPIFLVWRPRTPATPLHDWLKQMIIDLAGELS